MRPEAADVPRPGGGSATLLLVALGGSLLAQSQTPPVFRAEANLVEVIVRITDAEGRFVPGLTLEDFEVREQGRRQMVVAFDAVDLLREPARPAEASRTASAVPDMSTVITNERVGEARVFVLLLDDLMTHSVLTIPVRRTAREFVAQYVQPDDLVAVLSTSGRNVLTQDFTTDKSRVLAAIDRFMGAGCGWTETLVAIDFMGTLADHLRGIRGRRVSVIWISEGVGLDLAEGTGLRGGSNQPLNQVLVAMRRVNDTFRRDNLTLYAVDPRKLFAPGPDALGCYAQGVAERQESLASLRRFSEATGGFAAISTNDFHDAFERILDESSQYYVLGYQPATSGRQGDFRRIDVTIPGRRGLRVSARAGYVVAAPPPPVAGPPGAPSAVGAPLVANVPTAGLALRVQAIPRRGTAEVARVRVVVEVPGRELRFTAVDGRLRERVHFALRVIDDRARPVHDLAHTMDLALTVDEAAEVTRTGLRWLPAFDLESGHYSLRVSGHAVGTGRLGSVFADIDVPRFDDAQRCPPLLPELCGLWIGGLAVTSLPAALARTQGTSPATLGLPTPPTTARRFVAGDVMTVTADVVTPRNFTTGTLRLTVHEQTAHPDDRPPLLDQVVELPDRTAAHEVRPWTIHTAHLGPGAFVLRLTLRESRGGFADSAVLFDVVDR
jgi:VWFA-related protein